MRRIARWPVIAVLTAGCLFLGPSAASARHNLSVLNVGPGEVRPGGEVQVSGFSYTQPVSIRFKALDGPVLATLTPDSNSDIAGAVVIPPETAPGTYLLFAVQDSSGKPSRLPARARVTVVGEGGKPVLGAPTDVAEHRPEGLVRQVGASTGSLVLVGFGVAGAVLFLAGLAAVAASSPGRKGAAAEVSR